jgi:serine/threonine-protein kinase
MDNHPLARTEQRPSHEPSLEIRQVVSTPPGAATVVDRRYRVLREIARGGMGLVLEVRHVHVGRSAALKMLLPEWRSSPEATARLAREAAVLGAIDHPNVVQILDAGEDGDGARYLAMEHLNGRTLEGLLLAKGPLDPWSVIRIGSTLATTLHALHRAGFVHRDLKPGNVFLDVHPAHGERLKLIDFGIATAIHAEQHGPVSGWKTTQGELLGTPGYMPSEQILGQAVSDRSDVFALAATLHECLTGAAPYAGELTSILSQVLTGAPPQPLRSLRPDVPEALASLLEEALRRDPEARPSSEEFAGRLAALVRAGGLPSPMRLLAEEGDAGAPIPLVRRRVHPRYPFVTRVRLVLPDRTIAEGRSEEISEGGLQLRLPAHLALEGAVTLYVDLPGRTIALQGAPRWSRVQGAWRVVGVQLTPDETGWWTRHVRQIATQYPALPPVGQ